MVDWVRALNHIGYEGRIYAISRGNIMPWKFDPNEHLPENDDLDYKCQYLDFERITNPPHNLSTNGMMRDLVQEIKAAKAHGVGQGVLLSRLINELAPAMEHEDGADPEFSRFFNYLSSRFGNPTPPQNMDLINRLKARNSLKLLKSGLNANNIAKVGNGFELRRSSEYDGLKVQAVFDAAIFARSAIDYDGEAVSPLLREMQKKNMLLTAAGDNPARLGAVFAAGAQNVEGLYMANGPATNRWKWGIESFRGKNEIIAQEVANNLLEHYV